MKKIILVCREPEEHGHTVALIGEMFPECTIEIIKQPKNQLPFLNDPFESIGDSLQFTPFPGSY